MLRKAYTPLSLLLTSILLIVVGILFIDDGARMLRIVSSMLTILVSISAVDAWIKWFAHRKITLSALWKPVLTLALAVLLSIYRNVLPFSLSLLFGIWVLINALGKFLYGVQLVQTRSRGVILTFFQGIIYLLFALTLMFHPLAESETLGELLGIYCIVNGFFMLVDFVRELLGTDLRGKRVRQRVRMKPSVLLTALMPMRLLRALDDPDEEAEVQKWTRQETALENPTPNLEIFLHLSRNTAFGFGHVDIALEDKVYTYGCYDATSNRLGGILSDGILVEARRTDYIRFSLEHEKKRLIGYGVVLSEKQMNAVQRKLAEFLENSTIWVPTEKNPVQQELAETAGAVYHRIGKGPFKTYNTLTTNCVAVSNMLSGSGGVDLMNPQGIITPGTYAEFLDRQFRRPRSIVVARKVYR